MKNLLSFVLLVFFLQPVVAQSCLPSGITLGSQEDIDNFSTNYSTCTEIEGKLTIGSVFQPTPEITNLAGLSQLTKVGGLEVVNTGLTDLEGLGNLTEIDGVLHVRMNPNLESFSGLSAVKKINGTLSIVDNPKIIDFLGLKGLEKCAGIFIEGNALLQSFNGLENLKDIGYNLVGGIGQIVIKLNNSLTNLNGLIHVAPSTIGLNTMTGYDVEIHDNPSLTGCAIDNLCEYLDYTGIEVQIQNNGPGCSAPGEINCGEYGLSGTVYLDANENGVKDPNETGLKGIKVIFEPGGDFVLTDIDGRFFKLCEEGVEYTMTAEPLWYMELTSANESYTETFTATSTTNAQHDFGYKLVFPGAYGNSSLTSNKPKCNSDVTFFMTTEFTGEHAVKGNAYIHYDNNTSFVSAVPAPSEINELNHMVIWDVDTMQPFETNNFEAVFSLPDENSTGQPLFFWSSFKAMDFDNSTQYYMDTITYFPIVLCSYDPNDKEVFPRGQQNAHFTLHNTPLTYTIRFQNVGNTEADDVLILDTLDSDLDMASFRVINSSFPVSTSVNDHIVSFLFKNIYLPDSTSNEPGSHGLVMYEVKPVEALADYTEIRNTAHIFFDNNPAIVTNTTWNTMVATYPDRVGEVTTELIHIHPNPTSSTVHITLPKTYQGESTIQILNQLGQEMGHFNSLDLDTSHLKPGVYFIKVHFGKQLAVSRLVVE